MDAAPVLGSEVFKRERIGKVIDVESVSLISNDDTYSLVTFAITTDVNQLAGVRAVAVQHRVANRFSDREFNEVFLSTNAATANDQAHEPIHQRRDQADFTADPGVHLQGSPSSRFLEHRLQRLETAN
jgi:hypothetical protein